MYLEIFNEVMIMIINYHLFSFTKFVSYEASYVMGYSMVSCIGIVVAVNITNMVLKSIKKSKDMKRLKAAQLKYRKEQKVLRMMMNVSRFAKLNEVDSMMWSVTKKQDKDVDGNQVVDPRKIKMNYEEKGRPIAFWMQKVSAKKPKKKRGPMPRSDLMEVIREDTEESVRGPNIEELIADADKEIHRTNRA